LHFSIRTNNNVFLRIIRKKRKQDDLDCKKNIMKMLRESGRAHESHTENSVRARQVQFAQCALPQSDCARHCSTNFSAVDREVIYKQFWSMPDSEKLYFFSKFTARVPINSNRSSGNSNFFYHFEVANQRHRVCETFFLTTLDISQGCIRSYFENWHDDQTDLNWHDDQTNLPCSPPQTGKQVKFDLSAADIEAVKNHILKFPKVESLYCWADSEKEYLERGLNIFHMYKLYMEEESIVNRVHVSYSMYSRVFNDEFKIEFFLEKKNLCNKCEKIETVKNPTADMILGQTTHLAKEKLALSEKTADMEYVKTDHCTAVVVYDLQKVFTLPKDNSKIFSYKRKMGFYNLTAISSTSNKVYNAVWPEGICGKPELHITNALLKILKSLLREYPELKSLILWSNSCVAQYKNQITTSALYFFLKSHGLDSIVQKFFEPIHGYIEDIDCAHNIIEKFVKKFDIHSPVGLIRGLQNISKRKYEFVVLEMIKSDYLDFAKFYAKVKNFEEIPFSKVCALEINNQQKSEVHYKTSFSESSIRLVLLRSVIRMDRLILVPITVPTYLPVVKEKGCIDIEKLKDLKSIMPHIPNPADREYYLTILADYDSLL
jgi:hypothetical protein